MACQICQTPGSGAVEAAFLVIRNTGPLVEMCHTHIAVKGAVTAAVHHTTSTVDYCLVHICSKDKEYYKVQTADALVN